MKPLDWRRITDKVEFRRAQDYTAYTSRQWMSNTENRESASTSKIQNSLNKCSDFLDVMGYESTNDWTVREAF